MTDMLHQSFPQQDDPEEVRRAKALELIRTPLSIVSGAELRLAGAKALHALGDISAVELDRYRRAVRRGD